MRVRFSTSVGLPIVEEGLDEAIGTVSGILIHPDTGTVEGLFVSLPQAWFSRTPDLLLVTADILHWGTAIRIRSADVLSPIEDRIRLQTLLEESRTVLGQGIVTEGGKSLGTCADVQFDTKQFRLEWLFPRAWFRWTTPVPASSIVEVRRDVIVVRDPLIAVPERPMPVPTPLDRLTEAPAPRAMNRR